MDINKKYKLRLRCRNCHNLVDIYKDELEDRYKYGVLCITSNTDESTRQGFCKCARNIEPGERIFCDIVFIKPNENYDPNLIEDYTEVDDG